MATDKIQESLNELFGTNLSRNAIDADEPNSIKLAHAEDNQQDMDRESEHDSLGKQKTNGSCDWEELSSE